MSKIFFIRCNYTIKFTKLSLRMFCYSSNKSEFIYSLNQSNSSFNFMCDKNKSLINLFSNSINDIKTISPFAINKISNSSNNITSSLINKESNFKKFNKILNKKNNKLNSLPKEYLNTDNNKKDILEKNDYNALIDKNTKSKNINNSLIDYNLNNFKEILIAGKSNVGKSSLLNTITNCKIVSVSKTPGKTNNLHFINNKLLKLSLVDSPGYGFANRSDKELKSWKNLMEEYISKSKNLIKIIVLIDSEHGISSLDEGCINLGKFKNIETIVVFTKCDKLKNKENFLIRVNQAKKCKYLGGLNYNNNTINTKSKNIDLINSYLSDYVFFTSSRNNMGINELLCFLIHNLNYNN